MDSIINLNGKEFLICKEIEIYNNHYIYAQSLEDEKYTLLRQTTENGESFVESISDEEEFEMVLSCMGKEESNWYFLFFLI